MTHPVILSPQRGFLGIWTFRIVLVLFLRLFGVWYFSYQNLFLHFGTEDIYLGK